MSSDSAPRSVADAFSIAGNNEKKKKLVAESGRRRSDRRQPSRRGPGYRYTDACKLQLTLMRTQWARRNGRKGTRVRGIRLPREWHTSDHLFAPRLRLRSLRVILHTCEHIARSECNLGPRNRQARSDSFVNFFVVAQNKQLRAAEIGEREGCARFFSISPSPARARRSRAASVSANGARTRNNSQFWARNFACSGGIFAAHSVAAFNFHKYRISRERTACVPTGDRRTNCASNANR